MIVKFDSICTEGVVALLEFVNDPTKNVLCLSNFAQEIFEAIPFIVVDMAREPFFGSGGGGKRDIIPGCVVIIKAIKPEDGFSRFAVVLEILDRVWLSDGGFNTDGRKRNEVPIKIPVEFLKKVYDLVKV